jgi:FdhD protein
MPKRLALAHDTKPLARTAERPVVRPGSGAAIDQVVVEEPLEIRLGGEAIAVTMRTPGDDLELSAGFLFTETAIASAADIETIAFSTRAEDKERRNVVEVTPRAGVVVDAQKAKRSFYAASSCGLCGKATLDAIEVKVARLTRDDDGTVFPLSMLRSLPDAMRAAQATFASTGGLHAAALFDAAGTLLVVREDIGRHNATDKVIGHQLLAGETPCRGRALLVSGRAGFEIVQKAAVARIPLVAAVSAPSSLAIDLAERLGITLVAFLRPPSAGIYTHAWRVAEEQ